MTTPMPRCSCGCGELLTSDDLRWNWAEWSGGPDFTPPWISTTCLKQRRTPAKKVKDGEVKAVAMGLVPAPRRCPSRPTTATDRPRKRGDCDTCGKWRDVRPMGDPHAQVMLCKECVPCL